VCSNRLLSVLLSVLLRVLLSVRRAAVGCATGAQLVQASQAASMLGQVRASGSHLMHIALFDPGTLGSSGWRARMRDCSKRASTRWCATGGASGAPCGASTCTVTIPMVDYTCSTHWQEMVVLDAWLLPKYGRPHTILLCSQKAPKHGSLTVQWACGSMLWR
jgi:hypothetical protein